MTTRLTERLRDLAEEAPGSLPVDSLWHSGRRRHRRRMVTVAALVSGLVALTAGAGLGTWRSRQPDPASPPTTQTGPMTIPDRFFNPSPWLPITRAPGRLVAVMSSTRDHFPFGSDPNAVAGVVAGSQTYRFLDLPGQAADNRDVALAPDGLHLAYWVDGTPPGGSAFGDSDVVGMATIDLVTGVVERHDLATPHGLYTQSLTWVDDSTVALSAAAYSSGRVVAFFGEPHVRLFRLGSNDSQQLRVTDPLGQTIATDDEFGVLTGRRSLTLTDGAGRHVLTIRSSVSIKKAAYDARSGRLAAVEGTVDAARANGPLLTGRVRHGHVQLSAVPGGGRYSDVVAWVDASHAAAVRLTQDGLVYDVVDVRTGEQRELSSKPWYSYSIAADALRQARTVPGIAPPRPWNPRPIAAWFLVVLALAGWALFVVRRSRVRR